MYWRLAMPKLYEMIPGWFNFDDVYREFVDRMESGTIVEVGSWLGRSVVYLAEYVLEQQKDIRIYSVDTWQGSNEEAHRKYLEEIGGADALYEQFLKNISPLPIDSIIPIRRASVEAAKLFADDSLDVVYIDASHNYIDVANDIDAWISKVKSGGIIAGHDYSPNIWNGVVCTVNATFGENIRVSRNSWIHEVKR
jgi:predicted O-methyltransferase YrrM